MLFFLCEVNLKFLNFTLNYTFSSNFHTAWNKNYFVLADMYIDKSHTKVRYKKNFQLKGTKKVSKDNRKEKRYAL